MARRTGYEGPFQVTLMGVAAGLVGTLVMTSALRAVAGLLGRAAAQGGDRPPVEPGGGDEPDQSGAAPQVPPTEQIAERLASQVFRTELSLATRQLLGAGIHWAYGALWGALSAQVQLTLRPPPVPYGVAVGLAVWLVGPARLVPALGLYERPASAGLAQRLIAIGLHVLYGLTTAVTLERLSGGR
jgi:hypothetical protein